MIHLLRHGDAEPDQGDGDAARRLTSRGEQQARMAGLAMSRLDLGIETCLASPRVRAWRTAELACEALGIEPEMVGKIGDGDYSALDLATGRGRVLIVGHEPVLSEEIARLTGANVRMKKGGLAILEPNVLKALLRPGELSAIAGS
ncbi:MAG: histidine phosphatase family protein [Actinomycetota bacterium]|nr:histidine phosphatase family protein [Actinomycetota bacterium]